MTPLAWAAVRQGQQLRLLGHISRNKHSGQGEIKPGHATACT